MGGTLMGEILALICAIMWASAVILYKYVGDTMRANTLNFVKNSIALCLLLPTALLIEGVALPQLSINQWIVVALSGYIGIAVADTFFLLALRYLGAGRTAIVASLYSPFVVILSIVFLAEQLALWQWLGFVMVLVGIMVVIYQRQYQDVDKSKLIKGAIFAASSVFFTASSVVAMKPILVNDGFFWMVSVRMLAGLFGMTIYLVLRRQVEQTINEIKSSGHNWKGIFAASICGSYLALLFWLAGFKYTNASIASVLNETASIFIVLMAWLFLKEPLTFRKLIGIVMTFLGVGIFLGLFNNVL